MKGFQALLEDPSFSLDTEEAKSATTTAKKFLHWISSNGAKGATFECTIIEDFNKCIGSLHKGNQKAKNCRAKMWTEYHKFRISNDYASLWECMLKQAGICKPSSMCYQYVGHHIFKELVKISIPATSGQFQHALPPPLTYGEQNALRYVAGYILRMLRKRLQKSKHPLKKGLLLCIVDLQSDDYMDDEEEDNPDSEEATRPDTPDSEEWVRAVNRGGLVLIRDTTYDVFLAIEEEVRKRLISGEQFELSEDVMKEIADDDNVSHFWSLLDEEWEEESSAVLLQMIVNQYVKVRGFAYATSLVEQYKIDNKETTQKSKGLRKQLISQPEQ